jgi:hypothetical protein
MEPSAHPAGLPGSRLLREPKAAAIFRGGSRRAYINEKPRNFAIGPAFPPSRRHGSGEVRVFLSKISVLSLACGTSRISRFKSWEWIETRITSPLNKWLLVSPGLKAGSGLKYAPAFLFSNHPAKPAGDRL